MRPVQKRRKIVQSDRLFPEKTIPQIRDHQTVDKQEIAPDLPSERNWKNTPVPLFCLLRLLRKAVLIPFYEKWQAAQNPSLCCIFLSQKNP